ncbi:hypothetical protein AVEN_181349-1 [Araneus ventricosus]|uniref:Uncharacterized protein n=1 Tax=Araneus ventricosus TaxID=182803 RepID=A0A4Y2SNX1_ARAVE|nr:hypothetical protein AVEN_181349-1 [Araneus ventricosus]
MGRPQRKIPREEPLFHSAYPQNAQTNTWQRVQSLKEKNPDPNLSSSLSIEISDMQRAIFTFPPDWKIMRRVKAPKKSAKLSATMDNGTIASAG